jgi:hypothetical protein
MARAASPPAVRSGATSAVWVHACVYRVRCAALSCPPSSTPARPPARAPPCADGRVYDSVRLRNSRTSRRGCYDDAAAEGALGLGPRLGQGDAAARAVA